MTKIIIFVLAIAFLRALTEFVDKLSKLVRAIKA